MLLGFVCMCLVRTVATSSTDSGCDRNPIGLQDRSKIPDNRFTASSYYNQGTGDTRYKPSNARLHGTYGWGPRTAHNLQDYLQVDLLKERMICGVATQGHGFNNEWVTQYKLHLSLNGTDWNTYKENGTEKIFQGNTGRSTVVRRYLQNVPTVRYIRFIPMTYYRYKAMRVEVYSDFVSTAPTCPPKVISATAVSSTIIRLMWDPPPDNECRNGKLKGYFVSWFNTLTGGRVLASVKIENPNATIYIITGLEKYSEYRIKLRAYNQYDKTSPPDVITTKTSEDAPSCSPTISSVNPISSTSILVDWKPLPNTPCRNGLVRGYKMAYRKFDENKLHYINISNPNVTTKVVGGLRKYTNYSFQVLAYTIKDGNLSEASFGITSEDGSPSFIYPPKNKTVAKGEQIRLICNATGHPTPNISWTKAGGTIKPGYVFGKILVIPFANQSDAGKYICTAKNAYGGQVYRTSVEVFVTVKLRPHSPVPSSTQITDLSIKVHWKKPESHGYPVLMYSVHRVDLDEAGQEVTSRAYHVNEDVHQYEVGDIVRGKSYKFFVTAWNTHGESVKDHSKSITVNVQKP